MVCGMMVLEWYHAEQAIVAVLLGKEWIGVGCVDASECGNEVSWYFGQWYGVIATVVAIVTLNILFFI